MILLSCANPVLRSRERNIREITYYYNIRARKSYTSYTSSYELGLLYSVERANNPFVLLKLQQNMYVF